MKIPKPVSINCIKHHLGFITNRIKYFSDQKENGSKIKTELLKIGKSQMDLYTGNLTVLEISDEVLSLLHRKEILEFNKYKIWLQSKNQRYNFLTLSDDSIWTFLMGDERSRYIHIHPAKKTVNSIRVRANTLKTVIVYSIESRRRDLPEVNLELLNQIRAEYLDEPPVKSIAKAKGIINLISLIDDRLKQKTCE